MTETGEKIRIEKIREIQENEGTVNIRSNGVYAGCPFPQITLENLWKHTLKRI